MNASKQHLTVPYVVIGVERDALPELTIDGRPVISAEDQSDCLWIQIPIPQSLIDESDRWPVLDPFVDSADETEPNSPESLVAAEVPPSIRIIEPTERRQVLPRNPATGDMAITRINRRDTNLSDPDADWFRFEGQKGQLLFVSADSRRWQMPGSTQKPLKLLLRVITSGTDESQWIAVTGDAEANPLALFRLPETGSYSVGISAASDSASPEGTYRLNVQLLPADTRWWKWMEMRPYGGNPVHQLQFFDQGQKLCAAQFYNYLTVIDAQNESSEFNFELSLSGKSQWRWIESATIGIGGPGSWPGPRYRFSFDDTLFREGASFVSASAGDDLIVNVRSYECTDEVWTRQSGTWSNLSQETGVGRRNFGALAFDTHRREFVFFGGIVPQENPYSNDIWIDKSGSWKKWDPPSAARLPRPRCYAPMAFDEGRGRLVVFGGYVGGSRVLVQDMWEWDGQGWQERKLPEFQHITPGRMALTYDSDRGVLVLFCMDAGVWEFHRTPGTETWTWVNVFPWREGAPAAGNSPHGIPVGTSYHNCLCYDRNTQETLLVLSHYNSIQTWAWQAEARSWALKNDQSIEGGVESVRCVYWGEWSTGHDAPLLLASRDVPEAQPLPPLALRYWNGSSWIDVPSDDAPLSRQGMAIGFDPISRQHLMVGGSYWRRSEQTRILEVRQGPAQEPHFVEEFPGPRRRLMGVATAADGSHFATVTLEGQQWKLQLRGRSGTVLNTAAWTSGIEVLHVSTAGRFAAVRIPETPANSGYWLAVYDFVTNRQVLMERTVWISQTITLSKDGTKVAAADFSSRMGFWEWSPEAEVFENRWRQPVCGHSGQSHRSLPIVSALSGDGTRLFSAIADQLSTSPPTWIQEFVMWETATGAILWRKTLPDNLTTMVLSHLVKLTANQDGSVVALIRDQADRAASDLFVLDGANGGLLFEFQAPGECTDLDLYGRRVALAAKCPRQISFDSDCRGGGVVFVFDV